MTTQPSSTERPAPTTVPLSRDFSKKELVGKDAPKFGDGYKGAPDSAQRVREQRGRR